MTTIVLIGDYATGVYEGTLDEAQRIFEVAETKDRIDLGKALTASNIKGTARLFLHGSGWSIKGENGSGYTWSLNGALLKSDGTRTPPSISIQ